MLHDVQTVKLLEAKKPPVISKIGQFRINWHETERVVNQQWSRFHLVKVQKGCFSRKAAQSKHFLSDITLISSMTSHFVDRVWASYHETLFLLLILLHTLLLFSVNSLDSCAGAYSKATICDKTNLLTCLFLSHCLRFFSSLSLSTSQESELQVFLHATRKKLVKDVMPLF